MREIFKDATSQTQYLVIRHANTGVGLTGKVFGDVTGSYVRNRAARVAITMATLASASAAFSSGGFVEVDATNCPGLYRFDIPDAAFATGVDKVIVSVKVSGAVEEHIEFQLVNWNKQVGVIADSLATQAKADVNAEVLDVLTVDTFGEPTFIPNQTASLKDKIGWLQTRARNRTTQTATTLTVRNNADTADIAAATVSDDGTTAVRGKFA